MWRLGIVHVVGAALAIAQGFTFAIGSPVASMDSRSKMAAFVFRTEGCAELGKLHVDGTAEGLVQGARRSIPLKVTAMSTPGVYAVYPTWGSDGDWIVSLSGTCAQASAGALIAMGPEGFIRASSKFLSHPATAREIEAALQALSRGRRK